MSWSSAFRRLPANAKRGVVERLGCVRDGRFNGYSGAAQVDGLRLVADVGDSTTVRVPVFSPDVPIILASVISPDKIEQEIKLAEFVLSRPAVVA
jgi:hypothetical protein